MLQFLPRLIIFELDYMAVLYCLCCSKESTSLCRMRKNLCMCSRRRTLKFQAGAPAHVWLTGLKFEQPKQRHGNRHGGSRNRLSLSLFPKSEEEDNESLLWKRKIIKAISGRGRKCSMCFIL
ncbi:hypothetical protein D1007_47131 [Hordeum vulgare]|uniref:uncharacterized protein LOC123443689 n=1 Tax=Hordeum vulgare subsp. vulgare TaxID=112509 RepID=UPI00162E7AA3|nr:uncharacterized protein LOC123443689 [Hordeum vulgare subsp. vulgare]KAE8779815.1 hypothetical protein D1007_47131 [Hordeum vulgare]